MFRRLFAEFREFVLGDQMKKLLLASIAAGLALASGSAFAADMPVKAPYIKAPPPPVYSWTGCYLDAGGGYGMWRQNHHDFDTITGVALTDDVSTAGSGWYGTVGGGCDYQLGSIMGGNLVIGAFADYDFMDLTGTYIVPVNTLTGTEKESDAWAAGGRIGFAFTPTLMGYINAGWTEARFNGFGLNAGAFPTIFSMPGQTYNGWFTGGGSEMSLAPFLPQGFFLRSEYRYASYSAEDVPYLPLPATFTASHESKQVQTITTALVWKFNWMGH
jgi:outer membrane immunogenic protein